MLKLKFKKIILASKSPRRSQLLKEAGFDFVIKTKEVEESYPADLEVEKVAEYLAKKKAYAAKEFIEKDSVLLTADSIVTLENEIYGKPKNADDAFRILRELSGKVHKVITGVCLLSLTKERSFSSISKVHFEQLSDEEIRNYIEEFQPFDKAGAYAIQEWIGLCKISKIEGLYSNIMGLPVAEVYKELREF
jgi:nucleoside triphosphate pyrophosphatase